MPKPKDIKKIKEWKRKISQTLKKKGIVPPSQKGRKNPHSPEWRTKVSKAKMGHAVSEETRQKLRILVTGKRWKLSDEAKKNIGLAKKGDKNPAWNGGTSSEAYTVNWTKTLRRSIRERDRYICQVCGKEQGDTAFPVHHIDYNKKNNNPDNLIVLCNNCHSKTNHNREKWQLYFRGEVDFELTK